MVEENVSNRQEKLYKLSLQQQNKEKGMKETINQLQEYVNNLKEEYTEHMFCGKKMFLKLWGKCVWGEICHSKYILFGDN